MYEHKWVESTYDAPPENLTIYGDPVHIELKRRGVALKEAFNQIERYQRIFRK